MDGICRLCLTMSIEMACKVNEELKILHRLSGLNIQIHINDSLPSYVCHTCVKTLEDIENFREKVKQNESKLIQHFNNDNLDIFYNSLKNENASLENLKMELENGDEDYCDESVYFKYVYKRTETIKQKAESDHACIMQITKNETDENNMSNKSLAKTANKKSRRKNKSQTNAKSKRTMKKSNAKENLKEIENCIEINDKIDNILEPNAIKLESANESKTKLIEIENSFTKNREIEIKIKDQQCLTCFKYLISHSDLIKHYKMAHFSKEKCNNLAKSTSESEDKEAGYEHNSCNDSKIKEDVAKNVIEKPERPYNCKICGRTFPTVYAIVRHGRSHGARPLNCSTGCGYGTVYKEALRDHERRHRNDYKYKCATCGAGFHVKTWHDQHQNVHNNVKPFVCDVCGMAFHMDRYLTSHRTAVHVDVAKGASRYVCPHCDLAFHNANGFRMHLELHTGKRSFLCDLCGKSCASAEQLKYHNNSHSGVKPYSCSICNKKFPKKFNLTVHEKAHAGEKHLCQVCGKYFAQRSTLLRHHRKRHPDFTEDNTENRKVLNKF